MSQEQRSCPKWPFFFDQIEVASEPRVFRRISSIGPLGLARYLVANVVSSGQLTGALTPLASWLPGSLWRISGCIHTAAN